jgi:hypothetical protein
MTIGPTLNPTDGAPLTVPDDRKFPPNDLILDAIWT